MLRKTRFMTEWDAVMLAVMPLMFCLPLSFLVGCCPGTDVPRGESPDQITKYEESTYYFKHTGQDFARRLGRFRKEHPELQLITVAADDTGVHGYTYGYVVAFDELHPLPEKSP